MVSIPFKEILSSPLQNLSSVGISTLELPVILSFPAGSVCSCCWQHGSTATFPPWLSAAALTRASPVLHPCCCSLQLWLHSLPHHTLLTPGAVSSPGALPECSAAPGLVVALQTLPEARAHLAQGRIGCFSSTGPGYPPKWLNLFRSIFQEKSNRSVSQSPNSFPDSPCSFWICIGFSVFTRYLELLCLRAVLIYYKLITHSIIYFCLPK